MLHYQWRTTWNVVENNLIMRVLIVDGSCSIAVRIEELLHDYLSVLEIKSCCTYGSALDMLLNFEPDVVALDINMPDKSGIKMIRYISSMLPHIKVIVLTNVVDDFYRNLCLKFGVLEYFDKSDNLENLSDLIGDLYLDSLSNASAATPSFSL